MIHQNCESFGDEMAGKRVLAVHEVADENEQNDEDVE